MSPPEPAPEVPWKCQLTNRCSGRLTRHPFLLSQKRASPQTPLNSGVGRLVNEWRVVFWRHRVDWSTDDMLTAMLFISGALVVVAIAAYATDGPSAFDMAIEPESLASFVAAFLLLTLAFYPAFDDSGSELIGPSVARLRAFSILAMLGVCLVALPNWFGSLRFLEAFGARAIRGIGWSCLGLGYVFLVLL